MNSTVEEVQRRGHDGLDHAQQQQVREVSYQLHVGSRIWNGFDLGVRERRSRTFGLGCRGRSGEGGLLGYFLVALQVLFYLSAFCFNDYSICA